MALLSIPFFYNKDAILVQEKRSIVEYHKSRWLLQKHFQFEQIRLTASQLNYPHLPAHAG
jgi:hypothetical protein